MRHGNVLAAGRGSAMVTMAKTVKRQPDAPVFEEQGDQDADQQQAVADQVERELREEGRQFGHVAVDALDQFAGRVVVVEAHVEVEGVLRPVRRAGRWWPSRRRFRRGRSR
ncbi:MAG: hypothetical protein MZV64_62430 [Ignavibacteriales bacterium]|nr:hypothetical protein [Ignavibacteriales bacterium]